MLITERAAFERLRQAVAAGALQLVDEYAQPLAFQDALHQRCWAHLRDAQDGQVYVHELRGSQELLAPRYQELLGVEDLTLV
jgi:hypothetical protein